MDLAKTLEENEKMVNSEASLKLKINELESIHSKEKSNAQFHLLLMKALLFDISKKNEVLIQDRILIQQQLNELHMQI